MKNKEVYKITANIDDHQGYHGEDVTIEEELDNGYFIVTNKAGKEWMVGEEEIEKQ